MDPQLKAIKTIDGNLAVNAGAGTGKTKVLTERFVYILEHGDLKEFEEIESIVAITFTNKATEEMIERIREEIRKNFHKGEEWKRYYRDLEKANISTIHGFCAKILRENPIEANIDPYFEILDENISNSLLNQAIIEVLGEKIEKEDSSFQMMKVLNKDKIEDIVGDIVSIYNKVRTVAMTFTDLKSKTLNHIKSLEYRKEDIEEIKEITNYLMENLSGRSKIVKFQSNPIWIDFYKNNYKEDIYTYIEAIKDNLGNSKKEVEKQEKLKELISKVLLSKEVESISLYETVLDLLIEIDKLYDKLKREEGGLDYNDLQNKLVYLLDNKDIREKYQKKFKYFMIDEFQDTNELQKNIFYKLASREKALDRENLFIVGDPKQSIYRFRGADIDVFYDTVEDIASYNKDSIINLDRNYRSLDSLIRFTNSIFSKLIGDRYISLDYFEKNKSRNKIDVEVIDEEPEKIEGLSKNQVANIQEANIIASRIKSLVGQGRYNYGDFALLFRATTRNHIYEEVLKDYGIPYFNFSNKGFFTRQEIIDLINAIKSISNPYDHISTIGFLRGPMIGVRDDTIYWILKNKEENIYNTLLKVKNMEGISEEEGLKLGKARYMIERFSYIKDLYSLPNLIEKLIDDSLFIETLLLKAHGEQAVANVYKFLEITRDYSDENQSSLEDFIDYLEEAKDTDQEEGLIYSEDDNVVSIMTIHGSKGLQFPVVIIPEMARGSGGGYQTILFDKNIGIGIRTRDNKAIYDKLRKEDYKKDKEEDIRVLYVAITRAEKLLILGNQGGNSGFKRLIKDLLPEGQYKKVPRSKIDRDPIIPVKNIDRDLKVKDGKIDIPLLYKLDKHGEKVFNRFSISQYMEFKECKRRFFLNNFWEVDLDSKYRDGNIDRSKLSGIEKGNIVHEFCYLYREGMDKHKLLGRIVNKYNLSYEDVEEELNPYINNFLNYYSEDYETIYREKPFFTKIGKGYLSGMIDRITIKDREIELIDYKTNRLGDKGRLIKKYTPQIQIYSYVLGKILNRPVTRASILFLEKGEEIVVDISLGKLKETKKDVEEFINYVNSHHDLKDYEKSPTCDKYCPHKSLCKII